MVHQIVLVTGSNTYCHELAVLLEEKRGLICLPCFPRPEACPLILEGLPFSRAELRGLSEMACVRVGQVSGTKLPADSVSWRGITPGPCSLRPVFERLQQQKPRDQRICFHSFCSAFWKHCMSVSHYSQDRTRAVSRGESKRQPWESREVASDAWNGIEVRDPGHMLLNPD